MRAIFAHVLLDAGDFADQLRDLREPSVVSPTLRGPVPAILGRIGTEEMATVSCSPRPLHCSPRHWDCCSRLLASDDDEPPKKLPGGGITRLPPGAPADDFLQPPIMVLKAVATRFRPGCAPRRAGQAAAAAMSVIVPSSSASGPVIERTKTSDSVTERTAPPAGNRSAPVLTAEKVVLLLRPLRHSFPAQFSEFQ